MTKNDRLLDLLRRPRTDIENALIDEVLSGRAGRREFLRHGTRLGLSIPLLGSVLAASGLGSIAAPRAQAQGKPGGTLRVSSSVPAGAIDPVSIADNGGLILLNQVGEFLALAGPNLELIPSLAESWSPNKDGTVWTFKLRTDVTFHTGRKMVAADVVATIDRLANPKNASNALSAYKGVLQPGNSKAVDEHTVEFHLDAPNGNFPYLVSSDNYNAIILPADYPGDYEKTFIGTGPFMMEKYTPKVGASFVRNESYWGTKALLDRVEFSFYEGMQPQVLGLQGGQLDVIQQIPVQGSQALLNDPNVTVLSQKTSSHEQLHMRCDKGPFVDKRVRQALALSLNRPSLVKGLFRGRASIGNDSPFAPVFPSTDTSVPQREQDIQKARQLMAAAGVENGFEVTLTTERYLEIPDYAVLVQNAAKQIGITVKLNVESQDAYYGKAVYGESDWLDSEFGITDYGSRGVPNVTLAAPLRSDGTWNSAHFKNKTYDALAAQYVAAVDLAGQRAVAGQIQKLLLEETPVVFAYFYDSLMATTKSVGGILPIANRLFLGQAYLTA